MRKILALGVALVASPAVADIRGEATAIAIANSATAECMTADLTPAGFISLEVVEAFMKKDSSVIVAYEVGFDAFQSMIKRQGRVKACEAVKEKYSHLVTISNEE